MEADATFGGPPCDVVPDAIAREDLRRSVVHLDGKIDRDFALRMAQHFAHSRAKVQLDGGAVVLLQGDVPGRPGRGDDSVRDGRDFANILSHRGWALLSLEATYMSLEVHVRRIWFLTRKPAHSGDSRVLFLVESLRAFSPATVSVVKGLVPPGG